MKKIGEIMTESGYVTGEQVQESLMLQATPGEKRLLGQILVGRGYCTTPQVQVALARQSNPTKDDSEIALE